MKNLRAIFRASIILIPMGAAIRHSKKMPARGFKRGTSRRTWGFSRRTENPGAACAASVKRRRLRDRLFGFV